MMKRIFLIGCIFLVIACAPRKTAIQTEGLEEVVVFGEEEKSPNVSTEPVLPLEEPIVRSRTAIGSSCGAAEGIWVPGSDIRFKHRG
jgi:hypothetical protein